MNNYEILRKKIESKRAKICIVGAGYVGLPLAVAFSKKGFSVIAYDSNSSRIRKLRKGTQYIVDVEPARVLSLIKKKRLVVTGKEEVLGRADCVIVCVPTPLRKVKSPDISYVIRAARAMEKYLRPAQLIILESTSYPGTTREVVLPILRKSGLKEEKDFFVCFSPERVNPGDKKHPLTKIPKIVGGLSGKSSQLARVLYGKIIRDIFIASSPEVAETAKLLENTFRLVNIALVNEFTLCCDKLGISVWEVIEAAKTKPFGFMAFQPGPGVGGHCIPQDPIYLSWKARKLGFKTRMIDLAAHINRFMPRYVVEKVEDSLKEKSIPMAKARIMVLGVTYKKDVKDLRESPALDIIDHLQKKRVKVSYHDPLIPYLRVKNIDLRGIPLTRGNLRRSDCLVLATSHSGVNYEFVRKNSRLILDTRNVYEKDFPNVRGL